MVKQVLLSISAIVLTASITLAQQPPNKGFENWTNQSFFGYWDADSMATTNSLRPAELVACSYTCSATNPVTVTKAGSADAYSGSEAMRIESKKMTSVPSQVSSFINDTSGFAWVGSVIPSHPYLINGYTMTTRYADFTFHAKYAPAGSDSAFCLVAFLKRNGANRDTVAYGYKYIHAESAYKSFTITLTYKSTVTPDTAGIIFSATNDSQPKVGSVLFVDEMSFSGLVSSVKESSQLTGRIRVSLDRASNVVSFTSPANDLSLIELYDVSGRVVASHTANNDNSSLMDVSALSSGIYTYRAFSSKNELLGLGKFSIVR